MGEAYSSLYEFRKDGQSYSLEVSGTGIREKDAPTCSVIMVVRDITSTQIADEARLQGVALSAAANAIVITDHNGLIEWVNPAFSEMTGYSRSDCMGQSLKRLKSGQQSEEFYRELWQTIKAGKTWKGELVNRRKDGTLYHEEETITPVTNDQGEINHFIGIKQDVSERKGFEATILEREARIKAILDGAADSVIIIDEKGIITTFNNSALTMFGYSRDELIGQNVKILVPEPHHSEHDNYILRYLQSKKRNIMGSTRELLAVKKNGSLFPIELSLSEATTQNGQLISGFIRDISSRKAAEENLDQTRRQLQESNDNMLAILDESRNGVLMLDEGGRIQFVNRAAQIFLNIDKESLLKSHWNTALPLSTKHKQNIETQLDSLPESRQRLSIQFSQGNSEPFWGEIEVRDDPRDTQGKILFIYDVTEVNRLRTRLSSSVSRQMIGNSMKMREMFSALNKVAMGDWTVLIEGETGVGKELVANAIHATSPRKNGPFIAINCGGLTSSLLTSQLFGYRRGAFTGAIVDHVGLFEAANGGTLFLDEIGDVPIDVQTAMLRVLEEREVTRVGDTKPRKIDVRVLAATNRNLTEEVVAGRFRHDLLYRIQVARVQVPSLRERREDIPLLVNAFLIETQIQVKRSLEGVDPLAMQTLMGYHWPGNVRELKNAIDIATINCETQTIRVDDLPPEVVSAAKILPGSVSIQEDSKMQLEDALIQADGNRSKAAKLMGVSRATFYRRLVEAGIETHKKPKADRNKLK
jgi:PAS domain S-box-containing protein